MSAVVVFPVAKAAEGERFLKCVEQKRRFYFDNYFKRILHRATGDPLRPTDQDRQRGYVVFQRDWMKDVYYNDTPLPDEVGRPLTGGAFAGEQEPVTLAVVPLKDLGQVTVTAGDRPGLYKGMITIRPQQGGAAAQVPIEFRVRAGTLDPVDIPAGPWGYAIGVPWGGDDPAAAALNDTMWLASLRKMREYGFTTFSGIPSIAYRGFKDGKPLLDFSHADGPVQTAKELGFLAVVSYGSGLSGFNAYYQDTAQMTAAGFKDYAEFVKAVYSEVQRHAADQGWIPVYYNLGDEPIGDDLIRSAENAEAYRRAFPKGPPLLTAASSFSGNNREDPHFRLCKALHVADWNLHDEASVNLLHQAGSDWAFYNGGNRWTFGTCMYKAARQFAMKFRIAWHWNCVAGDPYYALDCREDDYAWCNASPDGQLIPAVELPRLGEGLDDYRRLLTPARLAKEKAGRPAAQAAEKLIEERMAAFRLGQRNHDALFGADDWNTFRRRVDDAITQLSTSREPSP